MTMIRNFGITHPDGRLINVTAASAATLIDATGSSSDVLIFNPGPATVHIKAGAAGVIATTSSVPLPAGNSQVFFKGWSTHLAMIASSGTSACNVIIGEGI